MSRRPRRVHGRRNGRDEGGALALVVAAAAVLLLSIAALGVDIGHAYVEKGSVQKLTDFAALSGGAGTNLPGTTSGTCAYGKRAVATDQAVKDVASYLGTEPWTGGPTPSTLVDCDLANGEVVYGTIGYPAGVPVLSFDENRLSVISPPRAVDFGLAEVMGFHGTTVTGRATVEVGTPGSPKTIPSYAVSGCDWGLQTITSPASGHVTNFVPVLSHAGETNVASLDAASTPNPYPNKIDVDPATPVTITINGNKLDEVTQVGFFAEAEGGTAPEPVVIPRSAFTSQPADGRTITFVLPDAANAPSVTAADKLWWVRVKAPETNGSTTFTWSDIGANGDKTVPFEVGTPYMRCVGASNEGNYGTLNLPRTDSSNSTTDGWMPRNIAQNLQSPLSLHTYPGAPTVVGGVSTAPDLCDPADARTVYSTTTGTPTLRPRTNCVDTDPGLPANAVSAGLVEGIGNGAGFIKGRLVATSPTSCAALRTVTLSGGRTYTINNDLLTCFLTADAVPLSTVSSPAYAGPAAFSCELYDSPRFFYQPVLQVRPSSGGSNHYTIVDFRPAFVTSQPGTAMRGSGAADSDNGVRVESGQITEVNVAFFNNNALSQDCPNAFGPALGGTTKRVVHLVN